MKDKFISSEGQIGRIAFIIRFVLLAVFAGAVSCYAIHYFDHWHHGNYSPLGPFLGIVVSVFCLMALLMQLLKRLRDMGKPAYWTLLFLIPGVNVLLLLYTAVAPSKS